MWYLGESIFIAKLRLDMKKVLGVLDSWQETVPDLPDQPFQKPVANFENVANSIPSFEKTGVGAVLLFPFERSEPGTDLLAAPQLRILVGLWATMLSSVLYTLYLKHAHFRTHLDNRI